MNAIKSPESTTENILAIQGRAQAVDLHDFKEIENSASAYTPQPQVKQISFDDNKCYNFLVLDTETNTTGIAAEICQLAAIDHTGSYKFSQYVLPRKDIDAPASAANNLTVKNVNNERKLFKNGSMLCTLAIKEAITKFESYISESIARKKALSQNKPVVIVLIGHNTATFDIPILLRNAGEVFSNKLQVIDVWFADSLSLFRELVKCKLPSLMTSNGTFPPIDRLQSTPSWLIFRTHGKQKASILYL